MNRHVNEIHVSNPEYNNTSTELFTERAAEEEPYSTALEQSCIETNHAERIRNSTDSA